MAKSNKERKTRKYPCRLLRVVDGDTYDVAIDAGFGITFSDRARHAWVDAWEMHGAEKELGRITKTAVELWWLDNSDGSDWPFDAYVTQTKKGSDARGKYGRWLVDFAPRGTSDLIGDWLVAEGHSYYEGWDLNPKAAQSS